MRPFSELVTIGRVVKPQGRKGEVLVEPFSDRPDRFTTLRKVFVPAGGDASREVVVTSCWPHRRRFVLKFSGIDSIDAAEGLRAADLRIGEEELEALPEGSYYYHQLRGLRVQDPDGQPLGVLVDILDAGSAPVLVVAGPAGEKLVPLAEPFVRRVDLAEGRIVVSIPESVQC